MPPGVSTAAAVKLTSGVANVPAEYTPYLTASNALFEVDVDVNYGHTIRYTSNANHVQAVDVSGISPGFTNMHVRVTDQAGYLVDNAGGDWSMTLRVWQKTTT